MEGFKLTATSVKDISTAQLNALRLAHEHNLEILEKEIQNRKLAEEEDDEGPKTVIIRLGAGKAKEKSKRITIKKSAVKIKTTPAKKSTPAKKKPAKKKTTPAKKKVEPTIKDMQNILSAHDIHFAKSWSRDRHWGLIKKNNLIRETRKFTETRLGLAQN